MLNDAAILKLVEENQLIDPFRKDGLQPHSYDAHLSEILKIAQSSEVVLKEVPGIAKIMETRPRFENLTVESGLAPLQFALASTEEYFKLPENIVGFVCGKSSIGRNGLQIENAGLIDAGFEGAITLEFFNMAPWKINLKAGMPICQIYFFHVDSPVLKHYQSIGHYNGQRGPTEAIYKL